MISLVLLRPKPPYKPKKTTPTSMGIHQVIHEHGGHSSVFIKISRKKSKLTQIPKLKNAKNYNQKPNLKGWILRTQILKWMEVTLIQLELQCETLMA